MIIIKMVIYMYYLKNFLLYSIIGFILETIVYLYLHNGGSSGILFGPWTPVYGIGISIILLNYNWVNKYNLSKIKKILFLFLSNMIILSIIELIGGYLIEFIFSTVYWNYRNMKFHIGNYISLEISIIWGLLSLVYIYLLKPISDKIIKRVPNYIPYIISILFTLDLIITIIIKINLN